MVNPELEYAANAAVFSEMFLPQEEDRIYTVCVSGLADQMYL
jgi:hypothetical protein